MRPAKLSLFVAFVAFCTAGPLVCQQLNSNFARDPGQAIDQQYTDQIHKYTTDPKFLSPLVEYLPASKTVPTPAKVLGDVSGAPDMLPYAEDVYKYFRMLEAASPCVKVVYHWPLRGRAGDDCGGDCRPGAAGRSQGQRRAAGQAGRSADDQHGRCGSAAAGGPVVPGVLHYGDHPLDGDGRADGADGAGATGWRWTMRRTSSTSART